MVAHHSFSHFPRSHFSNLASPSVETTNSPAHFNRIATEEGTPIIAGSVALGMTGIYLALEHNSKKQAEFKS